MATSTPPLLISSLPPDLKDVIFATLASSCVTADGDFDPYPLLPLRLVCRAWRVAVSRLAPPFRLVAPDVEGLNLCRLFPFICALRLDHFRPDLLPYLNETPLPRLRSLEIRFTQYRRSLPPLRFSTLDRLSLVFPDPADYEAPPALPSAAIYSGLPSLVALRLSGVLPGDIVTESALSSLRELDLFLGGHPASYVPPFHLSRLAPSFPRLDTLILAGSVADPDCLMHLPPLTRLEMEMICSANADRAFVRAVSTIHTSVRVLRTPAWLTGPDDPPAMREYRGGRLVRSVPWPRLRSLEVLELRTKVAGDDLQHIMPLLPPSLNDFVFYQLSPGIDSDDILSLLVRHCPQLRLVGDYRPTCEDDPVTPVGVSLLSALTCLETLRLSHYTGPSMHPFLVLTRLSNLVVDSGLPLEVDSVTALAGLPLLDLLSLTYPGADDNHLNGLSALRPGLIANVREAEEYEEEIDGE